jgi:hypothetical protein
MWFAPSLYVAAREGPVQVSEYVLAICLFRDNGYTTPLRYGGGSESAFCSASKTRTLSYVFEGSYFVHMMVR